MTLQLIDIVFFQTNENYGDSTANDLQIAILSAIIGALSAFLLSWIQTIRQESRRRKNIVSYALSELKMNREYSAHNIGRVGAFNPKEPLFNFILFKNKAIEIFIADDKFKINEVDKNELAHFIVVVEHVNSIIEEYKSNQNIGKTLINYCGGDSEEDSIEKNVNKIFPILNKYLKSSVLEKLFLI